MEPRTVSLEPPARSVFEGVLSPDQPRCVDAIQLSRYNNDHFDRGGSRIKEALWTVVRCLFFMPAWPMPSRLRCTLLRLFGARIGQGVVIRSRVQVTFPWRLTIGDHTWIGEEVNLHNLAPITIGHNVCLSQRAFLCTGSHDFTELGFDLKTGPINISDHSWIAANAFVAPNVELGPHAMVTAGSMVKRSVTTPGIISGNPATLKERLEVNG